MMISVPQKLNNVCSYAIKKRRFHFVEYTSASTTYNNEVLMTENAIVYVVKGSKEISIDGTTFSVAAGELFMLPQGKYVMSEYLPQNGEFKSIMLFFNYRHIADILHNLFESAALPHTDKPSSNVQILTATTKLSTLFTYLTEIDWSGSHSFAKELLDLKIKELIFTLLSDANTRSQTLLFLHQIQATESKNLVSVIHENLYERVSIATLAHRCHMSPSTFKREFQKEFHASPMQWINEKRLEKALLLIKNTPTPITDIAYECGFENYTHFSRRFKAKYGKPANDFRAKKR